MVAYRFCRPDDIPLLVHAVNECFDVHFPDRSALTLEAFQQEVCEINVWPSNCMIASVDAHPVSVCIATRREREVLISRVGTHPDYRRKGHAGHILNSLCRKLAVLGPSRMLAEIPERMEIARHFLEAAGYQAEFQFRDFQMSRRPHSDIPDDALIPVTVEDLVANDLLSEGPQFSWERQVETLVNRKQQIRGCAIASPDRIEGFILFHDVPSKSRRELVRLGGLTESDRRRLLECLVAAVARQTPGPVVIPRISEGEMPFADLQALGFEPGEAYIRYTREAEG